MRFISKALFRKWNKRIHIELEIHTHLMPNESGYRSHTGEREREYIGFPPPKTLWTGLVGVGLGGVGYGSPMGMRSRWAELRSALSALGWAALGWSLLVGVGEVVCACVCVCVCVCEWECEWVWVWVWVWMSRSVRCVSVRMNVRERERNEREFCVVGNEILVAK